MGYLLHVAVAGAGACSMLNDLEGPQNGYVRLLLGRIELSTSLAAPTIMLVSLGPEARIADMKFLACFSVICGGSGGTSGSVLTSNTTGRSEARAVSHACGS